MTTTCATGATPERDPVSETLATIDALITRGVTLAADIAALRARLADLAEERRVREALAALDTDGRTEAERQARVRVRLSGDADYRHLVEAERAARRDLAERTARLWALRMRAHACLALLRLAGGPADPLADAADAAPDALPEEDPS